MTIPLWLPWLVLFFLLAALLLRPESSLRVSGPPMVVLVAAVWLTVDHYWVTQDELREATVDAAAVIDGSAGVITADRIRVEIEDRLGRPVTIDSRTLEGGDPDQVVDAYRVTTGDGDGGPAMCVKVVTSSVAFTSTDPDACSES